MARWRVRLRSGAVAAAMLATVVAALGPTANLRAWAQAPPRLQFPTPVQGPPVAGGWTGRYAASGAVSGRHHAGAAATAVRSLFDAAPDGLFAPPNFPPPIPYGGQPVYPPGGLDPRFATPGPSTIYQPGPTTSPAHPYPEQ